jgi:protein-S-isoprenylcysteine O-methyltransferase Ste14
MWFAYVGYWWLKSTNVKSDERSEPARSRVLRLVLLFCVLALLCVPIPLSILNRRFLPARVAGFWGGAAVTALGLLFSVWGRRHLGTNWSQAVTVKRDHELITTGPYAFVRHPIYTGLLLGILGSAIAVGEWRGLLAMVFGIAALWPKLRLEEKWLRAEFGESYEAYSRKVSALLPHVI